MFWIEIIIVGVIFVVYKSIEWYTYWWKKNVDIVGVPIPFLGHVGDHLFFKMSYSDLVTKWYLKFKEKRFVGIYMAFKPYLLITDPILAKEISVDHFDAFNERGYSDFSVVDPLSSNLITMNGGDWKPLRDMIQPAMNTGRLKPIMPLWEEKCYKLADRIKNDLNKNEATAIQNRLKELILEIFVTTCYGVTYESFSENCELKNICNEILYPTQVNNIRTLLTFMSPKLINLLKWGRLNQDQISYLTHFYKAMHEVKMSQGITSKDLFYSLAEVHSSDQIKKQFPDWERIFTANSQVLLVAGFDSTHIILTIILWELARHPDKQVALYNDVFQSLANNSGKFSYEAITEMEYLDAVVNEALRLYPPFPFTLRRCQTAQKLTESGPMLQKGDNLVIPIECYHHDPTFFPDPLEFKPERFYKKSLNIYKNTYIPFGRGPRNCIGYHFARIQLRLLLAVLIKEFQFKSGPGTPDKIDFAHHIFSRKITKDIKLYPVPRNNNTDLIK